MQSMIKHISNLSMLDYIQTWTDVAKEKFSNYEIFFSLFLMIFFEHHPTKRIYIYLLNQTEELSSV